MSRAERRERGEMKKLAYIAEVMLVAKSCVELKVIQRDFHLAIMAKRQALEKKTPQEKQLIAEAMDRASAELFTMEDSLPVSIPKPKPEVKPKEKIVKPETSKYADKMRKKQGLPPAGK